jgi:phosphatidylserine synthase
MDYVCTYVVLFYGHFEYIIRTVDRCCCHLVYLARFGMLYEEKSGNPASRQSQFRVDVPIYWNICTNLTTLLQFFGHPHL